MAVTTGIALLALSDEGAPVMTTITKTVKSPLDLVAGQLAGRNRVHALDALGGVAVGDGADLERVHLGEIRHLIELGTAEGVVGEVEQRLAFEARAQQRVVIAPGVAGQYPTSFFGGGVADPVAEPPCDNRLRVRKEGLRMA